MKTLTCKELGGPCSQRLSAQTWDEMVQKMTAHVMKEHPRTADEMRRMHERDPSQWGREMKPKWESAPEA